MLVVQASRVLLFLATLYLTQLSCGPRNPLNANPLEKVRYTAAQPQLRNELPGCEHYAAKESREIMDMLEGEVTSPKQASKPASISSAPAGTSGGFKMPPRAKKH